MLNEKFHPFREKEPNGGTINRKVHIAVLVELFVSALCGLFYLLPMVLELIKMEEKQCERGFTQNHSFSFKKGLAHSHFSHFPEHSQASEHQSKGIVTLKGEPSALQTLCSACTFSCKNSGLSKQLFPSHFQKSRFFYCCMGQNSYTISDANTILRSDINIDTGNTDTESRHLELVVVF